MLRFRSLDFPAEAIEAHASHFGLTAFRDALVLEAEYAIGSLGVDQVHPSPIVAPRDHPAALRRPLSVAVLLAVLLTLLTTSAATMAHPDLYALAGLFGVATAVLTRLRLALRRPPHRVIHLPEQRIIALP